MFVPRLAALIVAFCLALPSAAEASLIWSIEVSSTHLSGTGQIAFSGPSSTTSPDFLFDFSGKYSNNTWSLTEDDVTATWEVDSNWILTSLDLDSGLFETDSPGVTATFSLVGSIDQFFAESFCFDSVSFRCHEDSFDVDQTENVVLTALHEIPEPRAYWLFVLGLSLLAFVWIRADKSSRRGFLASKHQY